MHIGPVKAALESLPKIEKMPRKYSRSAKVARSRSSRKQRGGGVFEFIVSYSGSSAAGQTKIDAVKSKLPQATSIVEGPLPAGIPPPPPNPFGPVQGFKWTVTTTANTLTSQQLTTAVNDPNISSTQRISGYTAGAYYAPGATSGAAPPSGPPANTVEIYCSVQNSANANGNPIIPIPSIVMRTGITPNPVQAVQAAGTVGNNITAGIQVMCPAGGKKITRVQFSPILVANNAPPSPSSLSFSIYDDATISGAPLLQDYVYQASGNVPSILTLSNVASIALYTSSTNKIWATSGLPAAPILAPPLTYPVGIPLPNLKITLTFENP